jgi:uncharacterized protein (TIGR00369 family)
VQFDGNQGSNFGSMIGAVREEGGEGYARMSLVLEDKHTNPNGVVHGGVICTLMDEASGWAVMARVARMTDAIVRPKETASAV